MTDTGGLHRWLTALIAPVALLVLAGCAGLEDGSFRAVTYSAKSDNRPHPGVARAHRFPIMGIDVSRWQGDIDWMAVRNAGTRFAFIKATEGGDLEDPRFRQNWEGARRAGIPRAAYHFVYWCRPAHEQAQWFVQHIPNEADALPPVLDVEWNGHSRTCPRKVPSEIAREKMRVMLRELERHTGKKPIIYTDITFHRDVIEGTTEFDDYPFWVRSTAANPEERYVNRPWEFWQWTTTGRVPGIRGDVDRNVFFGTEQEWQGFLRGQFDIGTRTWNTAVAARPQPMPSQPISERTTPAPAAGSFRQTDARPRPLPEPGDEQPAE